MNSSVRCGATNSVGSAARASWKYLLPLTSPRPRWGPWRDSSTHSDECWRFSSGSACSFASNRCSHAGVVGHPLHRVARLLDPVNEGVERDAVVAVVVQDVERPDLAVGLGPIPTMAAAMKSTGSPS